MNKNWNAEFRRFARLGLTRPPAGRAQFLRSARELEALGYAEGFTGLHLALGAQLWGVAAPLMRFGAAAQKRRFLAPLLVGRQIASPAITEEQAGSDVCAIACAARPVSGGYELTGRKLYVSAAPLASFFLVWARTAESRAGGLSCFLVERKSRGLRVAAKRWAIGPAAATAGELTFDACRVDASRRLGQEGQGYAIFTYAMQLERRYLLAPAVGSMRRLLEKTAQRAWTRRQFGKPIAEFSPVAHKLADMSIRIQAARAMIEAGGGGDSFDDPGSSAVKAFVSEAWVACCLDALQIHGAHGCLNGAWLRDELHAALSSRLFSGTTEMQKDVVARSLAKA